MIRSFIEWYISVGCFIWLMFFVSDMLNGFETFKNATMKDVARGALGIFVWPWIIWPRQ